MHMFFLRHVHGFSIGLLDFESILEGKQKLSYANYEHVISTEFLNTKLLQQRPCRKHARKQFKIIIMNIILDNDNISSFCEPIGLCGSFFSLPVVTASTEFSFCYLMKMVHIANFL